MAAYTGSQLARANAVDRSATSHATEGHAFCPPADEDGWTTTGDVAPPVVERWRHSLLATGSFVVFPPPLRMQQPTLYFLTLFDRIRMSKSPGYTCAREMTMGLGTADDDDTVNGRDGSAGLRMPRSRPKLARMAVAMS